MPEKAHVPELPAERDGKDTPRGIAIYLAKNAAVLVIGGLIGIGVTYWQLHSEGRTRLLEYDIRSTDSIVSTPTIPRHRVSLQLDDKPIESISQVTLSIYNLSDKDYESVPIDIVLKTADGSSLNVLTSEAVGAHGLAESENQVYNVAAGVETSPARPFSYVLKTANRSSQNEPSSGRAS